MQPIVIPRSGHNITRANISKNALKVLYRLAEAGFEAYLVGGGVRDLLLGVTPKDFDLATNCTPEQIRKLFRNCILIGKRFRLAHIIFGSERVEVATFRGNVDPEDLRQVSDSGMIVRDNVYGTLEEDAWRRDLTINALYYSIKDFSVIDYTGGFKDLQNRVINIIGDPVLRYREDPVRMLRVVRFAAKLGFSIAPVARDPIITLAHLLQDISSARLFDEITKWFSSGKSLHTLHLLREYGIFPILFPQTAEILSGDIPFSKEALATLSLGFHSTDVRVAEGKPLNHAFLFAVLLWWPLQQQMRHYFVDSTGPGFVSTLNSLMGSICKRQQEQVFIPQRVLLTVKEIWVLQYRFAQRRKKRVYAVLANQKFRAAFDFLLLREQAGEDVAELVAWWTDIQKL